MWPFRLRTAFKNRWWTLAFAALVCWQAADWASGENAADNAAPADENYTAIADALNHM